MTCRRLPHWASWPQRAADPPDVVRVAAVDTESPPEVAARADLTVRGAAGAVALLRTLAGAAAPAA